MPGRRLTSEYLDEGRQVVVVADDPTLFESLADLSGPDLDVLDFRRVPRKPPLALDEQRKRLDKRLDLSSRLGYLGHAGHGEPNLVLGLHRHAQTVDLEPAVTALTSLTPCAIQHRTYACSAAKKYIEPTSRDLGWAGKA
jgi:hypothetical protein